MELGSSERVRLERQAHASLWVIEPNHADAARMDMGRPPAASDPRRARQKVLSDSLIHHRSEIGLELLRQLFQLFVQGPQVRIGRYHC